LRGTTGTPLELADLRDVILMQRFSEPQISGSQTATLRNLLPELSDEEFAGLMTYLKEMVK